MMEVTCAAAVVAGSVFKHVALYILSKKRQVKIKVGVVTNIKIYPVKSLGGIDLDTVICTRLGPRHGQITDRHWMVVRDDGVFECALTDPNLNLIQCEQTGDDIQLTAPNMKPLKLPITPKADNTRIIKTIIEKEPIQALDCGDEAATWIQTFLEKPGHRIVFAGPRLPKRDMKDHLDPLVREAEAQGEMAFAADGPYLLVNKASLDDLNTQLDNPVSLGNFRGNIIVSARQPFQEESWKYVFINDVKMNFVKLCARCTQTTIHPGTSQKDPGHQPLIALNKYRARNGYKTGCFGVIFAVDKEGTVNVGDDIYAILDETLSTPKSRP